MCIKMSNRLFIKFLIGIIFITTLLRCRGKRHSKIIFKDNFEGVELADFWRPGDFGSGRYVQEAVSFEDEFHRSGKYSVKLNIEEGYVKDDGGDGHFTERTELDSGKYPFLYQEVMYKYSLLIPDHFPIIDNRLVISQIKQSGLSVGPLVAQRFRNGKHYLTVRNLSNDITKQFKYELPELIKEQWHDFVFQVYFSDKETGYINVWMNGKQVIAFNGITAFKKGKNKFYHKMGLYRDQWPDSMDIYFDDYLITNDNTKIRKNIPFDKIDKA